MATHNHLLSLNYLIKFISTKVAYLLNPRSSLITVMQMIYLVAVEPWMGVGGVQMPCLNKLEGRVMLHLD